MEFDSPEVMKDFPGLYSAEKRKGNDSDYNEEPEKSTKKEMIIGKRKEKKDKKDKDKGYAALEGESSDEASPCKTKKSKAFIFTKSKEKEKEPQKEKTHLKKKSKDKKKFRGKITTTQHLADALPIFGVDLSDAFQRANCHDGVTVPLPIRECIDYVESFGLNFENVYKISGPKNKVNQIKKLYNNRQPVRFLEYDVSTATSVFKTFLRELPEPIFTNDLLIRFEEAGAILNYNTREKHLKSLINSLPSINKETLIYIIIHLHNIAQRDQVNKMNKQNISQALHHVLHISSRLLQALITHRHDLFSNIEIVKYYPPLEAGSVYPNDPDVMMDELRKLESALNLIHWEMQQGCFSDARQDQLWEMQRIKTDLKRQLKKFSIQMVEDAEENEDQAAEVQVEEDGGSTSEPVGTASNIPDEVDNEQTHEEPCTSYGAYDNVLLESDSDMSSEEPEEDILSSGMRKLSVVSAGNNEEIGTCPFDFPITSENHPKEALFDQNLICVVDDLGETKVDKEEHNSKIKESCESLKPTKLLELEAKNELLKSLVQSLSVDIVKEKQYIDKYEKMLNKTHLIQSVNHGNLPSNFIEIRDLLFRENHMLEIKKMDLVRQIMESKEQCIEMEAKIRVHLGE